MTHSFPDFTTHVMDLLKNTGHSGPTGPTSTKPLISKEKIGTSLAQGVGPVENEWSHHSVVSGPAKQSHKQLVTVDGTTGTSGTTNFAEAKSSCETGLAPAVWHAILADLEHRNCPDWMSPERWNFLLGDAEGFLSRWGHAAEALGWTALDLYGVHPAAPAARFDVMGLLLLVQGGSVKVLTAASASIRRITGAALTFRRLADAIGAVLLPEVLI
jgi:hypothetical protein